MGLRFWFRDPDGTLSEIVGRVETLKPGETEGGIELTENAEEASVAMSTVVIHDPDMDFTIGGHRIFAVQCTDIADTDNDFIYVGYTADRRYVRDQSGLGRDILVNVVDINSVLGRRLMTKAAWNRSSESDVTRVTAVEASSEGSLIDDSRYILAAGPETMDEADYRGQYLLDVIRDCAEQTGKNYYLTYFGDIDMGAANPWGAFSLWYGDQAETDYTSDFRLTNVEADIASDTLIVMSAESNLDPSRVYSGVYLPYKQSFVYVEREATATAFALGGRDAVMPAVNVKTKAKALARANRYATDASTEDERITVVYRVPRADVNEIRPGQRVAVKFLHIDSVKDDYTYCRVLNRKITEPNLRQFEVTVELSPPGEPATGAGESTYGILRMALGPANGTTLDWGFPGDDPGPGYPTQPTTGLIEPILQGSPTNAGWPYSGWKVNGTGTVDVTFFATAKGVVMSTPVTVAVTYAIRLNGTIVASAVDTVSVASGFAFITSEATVSVAALAVVPDDVISATVSYSPAIAGPMTVPYASGQNGERLEITGGTLA